MGVINIDHFCLVVPCRRWKISETRLRVCFLPEKNKKKMINYLIMNKHLIIEINFLGNLFFIHTAEERKLKNELSRTQLASTVA